MGARYGRVARYFDFEIYQHHAYLSSLTAPSHLMGSLKEMMTEQHASALGTWDFSWDLRSCSWQHIWCGCTFGLFSASRPLSWSWRTFRGRISDSRFLESCKSFPENDLVALISLLFCRLEASSFWEKVQKPSWSPNDWRGRPVLWETSKRLSAFWTFFDQCSRWVPFNCSDSGWPILTAFNSIRHLLLSRWRLYIAKQDCSIRLQAVSCIFSRFGTDLP